MLFWDIATGGLLLLAVGFWGGLWSIQPPGKPLSSEERQKLGSEMVRSAAEAGIIGVSFLLPLVIGAVIQFKSGLDARAFSHFRAAIILLCSSLLVGTVNVFRLPTAAVTVDLTRDRATGMLSAAQFFTVFSAILRVLLGALYL